MKDTPLLLAAGLLLLAVPGGEMRQRERARVAQLPEPAHDGQASLERVLLERRSVRDFAPGPLTLAQVGQLLWAGQGITGEQGHRTAPSAGALYPLELYLAAARVEGLAAGIYRYRPETHQLVEHRRGDLLAELASAALGQECIEQAAAVLVFAAVPERTRAKYGERAERYVHMEVGHAAQNVCLQAVALGLGAVMVGAFEDERLTRVVGLASEEVPLALLPIGHPP